MSKSKDIDKLLNDDINLENYISKIEKEQIEIPSNLQERIISKVNTKKKILYTDICKIAACLIFSLAVCRMDFIKNDEILKQEYEKTQENVSVSQKISDFCKWFTTPLEIEKEER